ncbi:hypothetical protein AOQ84DRAFT_29330 [Glonium stellatum]|uniref:Uncharacterized protein n=1 Tax=Glonium stellatum TaxID=574774 RepID=A0A8E2FCI2_9PEZI|nr:hypothetical protein AOQ84DRAFT_29330 [Glonium stellatum]
MTAPPVLGSEGMVWAGPRGLVRAPCSAGQGSCARQKGSKECGGLGLDGLGWHGTGWLAQREAGRRASNEAAAARTPLPSRDRLTRPDQKNRIAWPSRPPTSDICGRLDKSRFHFYRCPTARGRQEEAGYEDIQKHKGNKPVKERMKFLCGPGIKIVTEWVDFVGYHRPGQAWTCPEAKTYKGDYRKAVTQKGSGHG